ncbi:MAG: hypothetical protein E7051_03680 [Lentisphaerae bacterium]|nr:hypothetical protein [Lentisphaerota bacterium]
MAQTLKYSANFKRNYLAFFALALFTAMIIAELSIALSIPHFVQRENAYAKEIRRREMFLLFDVSRAICHDIKEENESIKLEKKLLSDTLDHLAIYLRREANMITDDEVNVLSPLVVELYKIASQLKNGQSFSRENQLNSQPYLNDLLKKYNRK